MKLKSSMKSSSFLLMVLLLCAGVGTADENLLHNGELHQGALNSPAYWRTDSLRHDPMTFVWSHPPDAPSELQISGAGADMALWSQTIDLAPAWYRLSGELRTENIDPHGNVLIGVYASGGTLGLPIKVAKSSDWNSGVLYFKIGIPREVRILCMVGVSPGIVRFRRILLTKASLPPRDAAQIDLESLLVRRDQLALADRPPSGNLWTVPATILVLVSIALSGWLGFKRDQTD